MFSFLKHIFPLKPEVKVCYSNSNVAVRHFTWCNLADQTTPVSPTDVESLFNVKNKNPLDDTGAAFKQEIQLQEEAGGGEVIRHQKVILMMKRSTRSIV